MQSLHKRYIQNAKSLAGHRLAVDAANSMHDIMRHYEKMAELIGTISANADFEGHPGIALKADVYEKQIYKIADGIRNVIREIDASNLDAIVKELSDDE